MSKINRRYLFYLVEYSGTGLHILHTSVEDTVTGCPPSGNVREVRESSGKLKMSLIVRDLSGNSHYVREFFFFIITFDYFEIYIFSKVQNIM